MTQRQTNLLKQIKKESIRVDWEVSFGGKSYGNMHLARVNKIAEYLQRKEGGDRFLVLAAAWCHDVTLAYGIDDDPEKIEKCTLKFLSDFKDLETGEVNKIAQIVKDHEAGRRGISTEAKIIHDADVIDKSGMLGIIRHIWKMTNMIENRCLVGEADLTLLRNSLEAREKKVFTDSAKEIVTQMADAKQAFFDDQEFALSLMTDISQMSSKGMISDNIADTLTRKIRHPSLLALKNQLGCGYLS